MNITETLKYIHNVKWQGSKPGLSRTRELLKAIGNPQKQLKFVHVAGTNGKGSTCALLASALSRAGYTTGLYTSPYVTCFNERMQVNGIQISDDELIRMTEEIKPYADAMRDAPTEFEMITALAMKYFMMKKCDIVVLEVGMGGELDSTNVIETPELAVITTISYDHVLQLGPTLQDIARAKSGIIKPGGDVLLYGGSYNMEDISGVFEKTAKEQNAKLHKADFSRIKKVEFSLSETGLFIEPYGKVPLHLAGIYQPYNALVAITALEILRGKGYKLTNEDIIDGISAAKWPGRFELLGKNPVFILDGAHNAQGMAAAADSLQSYFGDRKHIFILGILADKDITAMIKIIAPMAVHIFTVTPNNPRALCAKSLAQKLELLNVHFTVCECVGEGVERALRAADSDGVVCALGSLFLSADIKTAYFRHKSERSPR
ncbi:MAG: bifunctional folylpolyglutamate synthase/dihydrofolate synthase [Oscillospiraceae bacterium]|nr:bifunctional folylpolyglutamate synthase/dihydrofolate synthase [Oscillospiraceae bacterium]